MPPAAMAIHLCIGAAGCSAVLCGGWVERVGPRAAGAASALCWCGGLLVAAAITIAG